MTDLEKEMAEGFYGYGHWSAPYWFIGPEQGQAKDEKNDLGPRLQAWECLGKPDLADLRDFHDLLEPGKWTREGTPLQKTWRKLMLILLTSLEETAEKEDLRTYQRCKLGRKRGETCLLELSGLPANSSRIDRDRKTFLQPRILRIAQELKANKPRFVVLYGKGHQGDFREIVGQLPELDEVRFVGPTAVLFTKHTNARKLSDEHWCSLGKALSVAAKSTNQKS